MLTTDRIHRAHAAMALLGAVALLLLLGSSTAAAAAPYTVTFSYTGREQVFVVPPGVSDVSVRAIGGPGGSAGMIEGGAGGTAATTLTVRTGTRLYVEVGGSGATGGWNGGARGGGSLSIGAGGGASDIRTLPRSAPTTLLSRLLVAGGGGGAGQGSFGGAGGDAGAAGASSGDGGGGRPGTQSTGGAGGSPNGGLGTLGVGGNGGKGGSIDEASGGGGGGGLFGGGGGGGDTVVWCCGGGGGGGSSYAPGGRIGVAAPTTPASVTLVYTATPTATTDPVGTIGTTAATLTGRVTAGGAATRAHFEYGPKSSYGSSIGDQQMGSGQTAVAISSAISGLQPAATYHYRLVATNANGTTRSADRTFTTLPAPPQPPPPTPRIDSTVQSGWGFDRATKRKFFLYRLNVVDPPWGSAAQLRCSGRRCRFVSRRFTRMRRGDIRIYKFVKPAKAARMKGRRFRAGQTVRLRISAPGYIGKVVTYTLKRGKLPVGVVRCLAPGATKPHRC